MKENPMKLPMRAVNTLISHFQILGNQRGTWCEGYKKKEKNPVKLISAVRSEAVCSVARTFWLLMQSSEAAATHAPPWSSLRPCRTPRLCTTIAGKSKFCPKIMRPFNSFQISEL